MKGPRRVIGATTGGTLRADSIGEGIVSRVLKKRINRPWGSCAKQNRGQNSPRRHNRWYSIGEGLGRLTRENLRKWFWEREK